MTPKISVRGLYKYYGRGDRRTLALQHVDLDVAAGEFVTLVGASGCGKSTLLRTICGLEEYAEGRIACNGRDVDGPGAERAMVFQSYSLYPWLTRGERLSVGTVRRHAAARGDRTGPDGPP
jgi:NitT/TauT family transport system ATP-binding protein